MGNKLTRTFRRSISRIWPIPSGRRARRSSTILHYYGYRHLVGHILPWGNDVLDASQRACDGISQEISGPRRWICRWMDVLVSVKTFREITSEVVLN